jgi:membrane-associated phospholipid phosphatase
MPGMTTRTPVEPLERTRAHRLARLVTEVCAPAVLAALMPLVIAVHATGRWITGIGWGALAVLFSSAIPYAIIWLGVRRGHLTDHHIGVREQRRRPLTLALVSVVGGLVVLLLLGAPRQLVTMVVVMLGVLLVVGVVNQHWKLSAHSAVATGSATVLMIVFGVPLLAAFLVAALVAWSRVELRDHTTAQVITGALVGVLVAAPTYLLLA